MRWVVTRKSDKMPSQATLFLNFSCNYSNASIYQCARYWITLLLIKEAMKHLTDSLSYCLEMERLLFPDPRQRVSEALIYHPAPNIIIQSRKLIKELTDDILVAVENESGRASH